MVNSLLYKTWCSLTENQQMTVLKAVNSPLFNQKPALTLLFKRLNTVKKHHAADLKKENLYSHIYQLPLQAYDDNKMRRLLSNALLLIRHALAWEQWSSEQSNINLYSCKSLNDSNHSPLFEREIIRAHEELDHDPARSDAYYFEKYQLELEKWTHHRQHQRNIADDGQLLNNYFAVYVAINSLRQGCTLFAQKAHAPITTTIPYLNETLRLAEKGVFNDFIAVSAWKSGFLALSDTNDEQHFKTLKQHIEQDKTIFPDSDLRDLYILAINVCIRKINRAQRTYLNDAFDLYRSGLESGVFLENGYLSKFTYRNILTTAVGLGEWDWAYQYLHQFRERLSPKEGDNIFRYNLATYYFRKAAYDKTLELLREVEMHDMLENFDCRRMLLRSYYALGEWDALSYLLDSFGVYLLRHKEGGYHREMYRNLVRFTKKLRALPPSGKAQREKLKAEIEATEYLAEKQWLLDMLSLRQ